MFRSWTTCSRGSVRLCGPRHRVGTRPHLLDVGLRLLCSTGFFGSLIVQHVDDLSADPTGQMVGDCEVVRGSYALLLPSLSDLILSLSKRP
jgi:hypothetical protein